MRQCSKIDTQDTYKNLKVVWINPEKLDAFNRGTSQSRVKIARSLLPDASKFTKNMLKGPGLFTNNEQNPTEIN